MKRRSRRKRHNFVVPIIVLIFCCIFTAMVAYGWNARKKNVKVADASKDTTETTVEVNNSETSSEGEISAVSESETSQSAEETTAAPESNPGPDEKVV